MRPTTDETLAGTDRLLRAVIAEHDLPPDAEDALQGVVRLIGQARTTAAGALPFLVDDSERMVALLASLPGAEVPPRPDAPVLDVAEADRDNAALREVLAGVVRALPPDDVDSRRRIRDHLLERLQRAPV